MLRPLLERSMPGDEELFQKDFELELSKFRTKTKPTLAEAIVKLWGDVSFEKKEFNLVLKGKF
jgi:hypothetical protein